MRHGRPAGLRCARVLPALLPGACAALLLGACSAPVLQNPAAPALVLPDAWSSGSTTTAPAGAGASALAAWWSRLDDPLLSELVGEALAAGTDVAAAQAALRQARALRDVAAAARWPRLDASARLQRSRSGDADSTDRLQADLDASWDVDLFGLHRSALDAAEAAALAAGATLGEVQVSTAAAVALAYIGLRGNQARLANAAGNLAGQQETLQLTQWRVQAGLLSALEAEQARAAADQTRAQLPPLQAAIERGAHALAVLTGRAPAALLERLAPVRPLPLPGADLVLAIPAETLRQRADVRAAEHRLSSALARVAGAEAARQPSFRLSGNLGLSALTFGALSGSAALASGVLASVSLPVFDGGAARAQVRVQHAALDQARAEHRATLLTALKEVEDALSALQGDRERLASLRGAAAAAANAALYARQRYGSGLVDFQTVLETQRTLRNAQDAEIAAAADLGADHVRLYAALGGGWIDASLAAHDPGPRDPSLKP